MGGRVNTKRAMRRMKMESEEYKSVVDACILIAGQRGVVISFPWELPNMLDELLQQRSSSANPSTAKDQAQLTYDRLSSVAQLQETPTSPTAPPQAAQTTQRASSPPKSTWGSTPTRDTWGSWDAAPPQPPVDPWEHAAANAAASLENIAEPNDENDDEDDEEPGTVELDKVKQLFEAKQAKMLQRVEETGIQYKNNPGPTASPKPKGSGNPTKRGMTRDQALEIIERATGRRPQAPPANPVPKPT